MSTHTDERRRFPRHRLASTGSNPVVVTVGVLPRAVLVRDIGEGGMGLLAAFSPPIGAVVPLWLPGRPGEPSALVLVNIAHVQPPDGELYCLGVGCHDESAAAAVRDFLARCRAG